MKIETLEEDVKKVLTRGAVLDPVVLSKFGSTIAVKLDRQLSRLKAPMREPNVIRASEIGMVDTCARKFWYTYHSPADAEPLTASTVMKFLYGDIIEECVITISKAAGHEVTHEQEEVKFKLGHYDVVGHIDCVIDGVLIDVKSTTSYGMKDFLAGKGGDKFGYRAQLNVYATGMGIKEKGWVVMDKQLGDIRYIKEDKPYDTYALFDKALDTLSISDPAGKIPRLSANAEANGNMSLGVECSYCPFKKRCWSDSNGGKGIRTFAYSTGPKYLVHVAALPKVPEVT